MSERWKPEVGEKYWFVNDFFVEDIDTHDNALIDQDRIINGNCFKTREKAESAAEKVKALLLSLHETATECSQLPKLTADVFDCPDCPEWAKYAAVSSDGRCLVCREYPVLIGGRRWANPESYWERTINGKFDASDWKNSLVERPAVLPEWCKVGQYVFHDVDEKYYKVESVQDYTIETTSVVGRSTRLQDPETFCNNYVPARLRPYNADEMRGLIGKVIEKGPSMHIVTGFEAVFDNECMVHVNGCLYSANDLLRQFTIDNAPCGKLEHLENGEWVE